MNVIKVLNNVMNDVIGKKFVVLMEGEMYGIELKEGVVEYDEVEEYGNVEFIWKECMDGGYDFDEKEKCIEMFVEGLREDEWKVEVLKELEVLKSKEEGKKNVEWFVGGIEYNMGVGFVYD